MNIVRHLVLCVLVALPVAAQTSMHWSMVGAAGVVDPGMSPAAMANGMSLAVKAGTFGTMRAVYPVTNVYGSGSDMTPPWTTLQAAFTPNNCDV